MSVHAVRMCSSTVTALESGCAATYVEGPRSVFSASRDNLRVWELGFDGLCADLGAADFEQWESDVVPMLVH